MLVAVTGLIAGATDLFVGSTDVASCVVVLIVAAGMVVLVAAGYLLSLFVEAVV